MPNPGSADLQRFLIASGLFSNPPTAAQKYMDLRGAMDAAKEEFERLTGYLPFLSSGEQETRTFDGPESSILQLRAGLLSLTSLVINTVTYTENSQFVLQPTDAPGRRLPYTYVDFGSGWQSGGYGLGSDFASGFGAGSAVGLGYVGGGRRAISITGVWGYCATLPADVKQALISFGAARVAPRLMHSVTGGLKQQKVGNDSWTWGENFFGGQMSAWDAEFQEAVRKYRLFRL